MTRREFVLGSAALAAAGSRERVRMGFIGVGNRGLEWDAEAERFVGCDEANALLHYAYRPGYALG